MVPRAIARFRKEQSGVIGLEASILVIALVVMGSVFATSALTSGVLFSKEAKETVQSSLKNLGVMELRGSVVLVASTTRPSSVVSDITFQVAAIAGGQSTDLTPGKIIIKYTDSTQSKIFDASSGFSATRVGSPNSDKLLEPNQLYEIGMSDLDKIGSGRNQLTNTLGINTTFSLEVIPPVGAVLFIKRTTSASLQPTVWLN